jgi:ArsR family transcriptional regulator
MREPLGRTQPAISHHAGVLAEAGLIRGDKRGKWTWLSPDAAGSSAALAGCSLGSAVG